MIGHEYAKQAASCNGVAQVQCGTGLRCADDPYDTCDPATNAMCVGVCVDQNASGGKCGGFAGFTCPNGEECADDPNDDCDPTNGGADCLGICVGPRRDSGTTCGANPCGACPQGLIARDTCQNGQWQCRCEPADAGTQCAGRSESCDNSPCCSPYLCRPMGSGSICMEAHFPPDSGTDDAGTPPQPVDGGVGGDTCGGFRAVPAFCASGFVCVDDPYACCMANDAPGVCVRPGNHYQGMYGPRAYGCGGFAAIQCPSGMICADDPNDTCDPNNGGADCPGVCY
jgi:hypothetical protein